MRRVTLIILACLLAIAPASFARTQTSVNQTILDRDGDDRLEPAPGEDHVVRQELAPAAPGREKRRSDLFFFGQMTDTHVIDEESPLRVEFLDQAGGPFTAAYRAHEGLSAQVLDQMVKQLRNIVSPVTQQRIQLVMTTGDNTDNTQLNETRWMIDVMDGGKVVNPDSGITTPACGPAGYDGVRGDHRYYEPDASDGEDGTGYSPRPEENGRPSRIRDYPGLFTQMNTPFRATGFGDLPLYAVFGNHDGLVQGNQPRNPALEALAVGCLKPTNLTAATQQAIEDGLAGDGSAAIQRLRDALVGGEASTTVVPPDPARRPLRKQEWMAEHFLTSGLPKGHGFANNPAAVAEGMGYYSFSPKPGLRFVVLDTVAEHGLEAGNVDDDQFNWLHQQLLMAESSHERVLIFAHHSLGTMGQPPVSPFVPPGDTGGDLSPIVHFGTGPRESGITVPCDKFEPTDAPSQDETVRCLLLRHPSVVGFVNGHEHNNRVDPFEGEAQGQHGFWDINTASHIDWPQQSRVIDLVDNHDGTLSLFGTIVDHAAAPNPGSAPAGDSIQRLASISRELALNDPQATHADNGDGGGRGGREDRNVELLVADPYAT